MLFSIAATPIYMPTSSAQGFPFLHIHTSISFWVFLMLTILRSIQRWRGPADTLFPDSGLQNYERRNTYIYT